MKISYEWLREYVNTKMRPEKLSHLLTMAGHEVESIEHKNQDVVFDMEITPNRSDCLSHIGMAKEVAAVTDKSLKLPKVTLNAKTKTKVTFKVEIEDSSLCSRYSCRVLKDLKVSQSPKWLIRRLESIGLRPINNVVDSTNFVLFETGQPLHAFDADKIDGKTIYIRNARKNEKIVTLDGVERLLSPSMLIIADQSKPIAIAGVMGGKDTEVTNATKNILLESAYFNNISVRRTAAKLSLSTDSSYRFERGIDIDSVVASSDRASSLIVDIAKATTLNISDYGIKKKPIVKIDLRSKQLNKVLGTDLNSKQITSVLEKLGFKVTGTSLMEIIAPSYRHDVSREADLIEEVARIFGYENIETIPLSVIVTDENELSKRARAKREITKNFLISSGYSEALTYSLLSKQAIKDTAFSEDNLVVIRNPLSKEQEAMRQSLLPGLLKAVSYNLSRQVYDIKFYELSNIYFKQDLHYKEEPSLAIIEYGKLKTKQSSPINSSPMFDIKGAVTSLSERLSIKDLSFENTTHPLFVKGQTIAVLSEGRLIGTIGKIKESIAKTFNIKGAVFAGEFNFDQILLSSTLVKSYKVLPRFPYSYRDISFALENQIPYKEIASLIKKTGGPFIESIELLSEYQHKDIGKDKRALALRVLFRAKEKTLTEDEIATADTAIRKVLVENFNVTLR